ncbi:hypothetical protein [Wenxinia saemankumensis]|uniref:Uncharacterized protein n=1 Tax=Wenxinia saemankumensis TaxID=1447782 RepID=A0A1M6AVA8_9RHOB|nr:hypothetical protein [Wenxinia saemankumensis]SHI40163.1 hypothetical protein SAMN05444417_0632 [Wenxinia saemankumensis]
MSPRALLALLLAVAVLPWGTAVRAHQAADLAALQAARVVIAVEAATGPALAPAPASVSRALPCRGPALPGQVCHPDHAVLPEAAHRPASPGTRLSLQAGRSWADGRAPPGPRRPPRLPA